MIVAVGGIGFRRQGLVRICVQVVEHGIGYVVAGLAEVFALVITAIGLWMIGAGVSKRSASLICPINEILAGAVFHEAGRRLIVDEEWIAVEHGDAGRYRFVDYKR